MEKNLPERDAHVMREPFGVLPDGRVVERIRLRGAQGFEVAILTYGAVVQALHVPDREGRVADIVLGHDDLGSYLAHRLYFGAAIGRYANRIAGGRFALDGKLHAVPANDGLNALHGGPEGFDRRLWSVTAISDGPSPSVRLSLVSPHGDQGFPGELKVDLTYQVARTGQLSIVFEARTDRPTVASLTHHGYFNLAGVASGGDVLDHMLTLHADHYLPIGEGAIPLGGGAPVAGTPFDFRTPRTIGERLREADGQLLAGHGYDHNYCLADGKTPAPRFVARVEHPASGRVMELLTDQPGLQFYSGNYLDGSVTGKYGRAYRQSDAFCLEPQGWPDAPNRPDYPSARLDPGEVYRHSSIYRFLTA